MKFTSEAIKQARSICRRVLGTDVQANRGRQRPSRGLRLEPLEERQMLSINWIDLDIDAIGAFADDANKDGGKGGVVTVRNSEFVSTGDGAGYQGNGGATDYKDVPKLGTGRHRLGKSGTDATTSEYNFRQIAPDNADEEVVLEIVGNVTIRTQNVFWAKVEGVFEGNTPPSVTIIAGNPAMEVDDSRQFLGNPPDPLGMWREYDTIQYGHRADIDMSPDSSASSLNAGTVTFQTTCAWDVDIDIDVSGGHSSSGNGGDAGSVTVALVEQPMAIDIDASGGHAYTPSYSEDNDPNSLKGKNGGKGGNISLSFGDCVPDLPVHGRFNSQQPPIVNVSMLGGKGAMGGDGTTSETGLSVGGKGGNGGDAGTLYVYSESPMELDCWAIGGNGGRGGQGADSADLSELPGGKGGMGGNGGDAGQLVLDGPITALPNSPIKPGDKGDGGSGGRGTPPGTPGDPGDEGDSSPTASIPEKPEEAKLAQWTVMVYGAGDAAAKTPYSNDVEAKLIKQIEQLETVNWSERSVNMLCLLDRHPVTTRYEIAMPPEELVVEGTGKGGYWHETRMGWINYHPQEGVGTRLGSFNALRMEEDTGSIDTLGRFVDAAISAAPAEHYMLVIAGHGGGWCGVAFDSSTEPEMPSGGNSRITPAEAGNSAAWIDSVLGQPLDVLVLDACVSQVAEIAAEVKDSVSYLVATQTNQPGRMDLGAVFKEIWPNTPEANTSAEQVAKSLLTKPVDVATFSVLDLSTFETFETALREFVNQALTLSESDLRQLRVAARECPADDNEQRDVRDFMIRASLTLPNTPIAAAASRVQTALGDLVIARQDTELGGLSIYLPAILGHVGLYCPWNPTLQSETNWDRFLTSLLGGVIANPTPDLPDTPSGNTIEFEANRPLLVRSTIETDQDVDFIAFDALAGQVFEAGLWPARLDWEFDLDGDGIPEGVTRQMSFAPRFTLFGTDGQTVLAEGNWDPSVLQAIYDSFGDTVPTFPAYEFTPRIARLELPEDGTYYLAVESTPLPEFDGPVTNVEAQVNEGTPWPLTGDYTAWILVGDATVLQPVLTVAQTSVELGTVSPDTPLGESVTITNEGGYFLEIEDVSVDGDSPLVAPEVLLPLPLIVAPGESISLDLTFTHFALELLEPTEIETNVVVISNDPTSPRIEISISGTALPPGQPVPNTAPTLATIPGQTITENTTVQLTASATDSDLPAQTLTYSLDAGAPTGASIDPVTGEFSWTTSEVDGPGTHSITVRVTDDGPGQLDNTETFTVTVQEQNTAPTLAAISNRTISEGNTLQFAASATDPDLPVQTLTYSLDAGAPTGATIDPVTGIFSWTTTEADGPGNYSITVRVTDDGPGQLDDAQSFAVTVTEEPFTEIEIRSNGHLIADGDTTPSSVDATHFGSVDIDSGITTRTFAIDNVGTETLHLTGTPTVQLSGANAADFTVLVLPGSTVEPGGTVLFEIRFDPSATGTRTAIVSISSDDQDESSYTFAIAGIGTETGNPNPGTILYVDDDSTTANPTGSSWNSAFANLHNALDAAETRNTDNNATNDVSQIWIAGGVYRPSHLLAPDKSQSATFEMLEDVALYGGFLGTETVVEQRLTDDNGEFVHETVLSGDLLGNDAIAGVALDQVYLHASRQDNAYTVVRVDVSGCLLDGLTITAGNAVDTEFVYTETSGGGGIYVEGANAQLDLNRVRLISNTTYGNGAAIHVRSGHVTMDNCQVSNNAAHGGTIMNRGEMDIYRSRIESNHGGNSGEVSNHRGVMNILQTSILHNAGLGVYSFRSTLEVFQTEISGNTASLYGGVAVYGGDATICQTTITGNRAFHPTEPRSGGLAVMYDADVTVHTSLIAGNSSGTSRHSDLLGELNSTSSFNLIGNGSDQTILMDGNNGNHVGTAASPIDPQFVDPSGGDYRLLSNSPAVNAGSDYFLPADTLDLDKDGNLNETVPVDLNGKARIVNGTVDIGAYETQLDTTPPTATLTVAPNVTIAGGEYYEFQVTYTDDRAIDVSSMDGHNLVAWDPNGNWQRPEFMHVDEPTNGTPRIATYRILAPGGDWDVTDNGTYSIETWRNDNVVRDTSYNRVPAETRLGEFQVEIPAVLTTPQLTATALSETSVKLSWTDTNIEAGYHILRNGSVLKSVAADATSAVVSDLTPGTTYTFVVRAYTVGNAQTADSNAVQVSTHASTIQDLGSVDQRQLSGLDLSAGALSYRLVPQHAGYLTFSIEGSLISPVEILLYDEDPTGATGSSPLAIATLTPTSPRVDWTAVAGEAYFVELSGTDTNFELQITNLVHPEGTTVTVFGTDQGDVFAFNMPDSQKIVINGVEYAFDDTEAATVAFTGGDGFDTAWLYDSAGNETLEAWPDRATLTNESGDSVPDYTVNVAGIESLLAYATRGGADVATLHGSDHADKLKSYENSARLRAKDNTYALRAKKFDAIESDAGTAGNDLAVFNGSDGHETFTYLGAENCAQIEAEHRNHTAEGFDVVVARAGGGADDVAYFTDTTGGDVVYLKSHKTLLVGQGVKVTARAFDEVHAMAIEGGRDVARLYDTPGNEHLEVAGDAARLYRRNSLELDLIYEVLGFERVKAYSTEGDDTKDVQEHTVDLLLYGWDE